MQMYLWKAITEENVISKQKRLMPSIPCYFCPQDVRRRRFRQNLNSGIAVQPVVCVHDQFWAQWLLQGLFAWADPEEEIVYVFLSNRTYPDAENRMLISSDLRSRIQEAIYEAIIR